jgi:SAM-dependent methyltransferase
VTLVDISQAELDLAAQYVQASNVTLESIICADASKLQGGDLNVSEASFDAILLLGPLYHLLEPQECINTLTNCTALLKPDGIIFAAFLTKFGHLRGVARNDPGRLVREWPFYEKYLQDGKYDRRQDISSHHIFPNEIRELFGKLAKPRLTVERLVACESFLGSELSRGLNELDRKAYDVWEKVLFEFAEDPCILGTSEHILAVVRRA